MGELKQLVSEIIGWESNKVSRTLKGLTISPGATITKFCEGDRKKFVHPVSYLVGIAAIFVFVYSFVPDPLMADLKASQSQDFIERTQDLDLESEKYQLKEHIHNSQTVLNNWITTVYPAYLFAVFMTILHLFVFRKFKKGLKNNVWFSVYCFGHLLLLNFLILPFYWSYYGYLLATGVTFLLFIIYRSWAAKQFYEITWGHSIKKNIVLVIISYVSLWISIAIIFIAYTIISFKYNLS